MENTLFKSLPNDAFNLKDASSWASNYLGKNITVSNITYLINYGKVKKIGDNRSTYVSKNDLKRYYDSYYGKREINWKSKLGEDLNWHLSFDYLKESDTTKHVHRLHPYKGKFIPQLVEYFLDKHTDEFKKEFYFKAGDIVLDPFCGSGTTLIQANELGINAIGVDVSAFNSLISNVKIGKYNIFSLKKKLDEITNDLRKFIVKSNIAEFENTLAEELVKFNNKYFPSPDFKHWIKNKEINEFEYGRKKEIEFLKKYNVLIKKYNIELNNHSSDNFIEKWYLENVKKEIYFVFDKIKNIDDSNIKKITSLILSRTIRSCRATTHFDLATLIEPISKTYYCHKHGKICKPLFSILSWWERYSKDTLKRISDFAKIRTDTQQICLTGDSREINLLDQLKKRNSALENLVRKKKINGIFSSPPYVGLIDYHEQHAYAYDLFGYERNDDLEIGPLYKGKGKEAKDSYVDGISKVLINMKKYLVDDFNIFLVANDKNNLYPAIAEKSNLKIVQQFKRPVLNRTERDKTAYSEIIFHLKKK